MYYNLDLFGKEVRKIRSSLGYTQKYISDLTTINIDTMRKIENGKVTPNHITLELLSTTLKVDLNQLLLRYRFDSYSNFNELINRIDLKLESGSYEDLLNELQILNDLVRKEKNNQYVSNMIMQLYLFVASVMIKIRDKDFNLCLSKLIESIKITTPYFDLSNYESFVYNSIEIRLLMNIALALNNIESKSKCLEILRFCLTAIDSDELDIKILYNLAYTCYKLDLHKESLYYSDLGINTCVTNNSLSYLDLLYSRKGIAEYYLGFQNYKDTLSKALLLYDISGKENLKNMFIKSCKNIHKINLAQTV